MKRIAILNGPNLDRLGQREPEVYGSTSLAELESSLRAEYPDANLDFFQSNNEGALVDKISQLADDGCDGIVFNPAAFSHTSIALRDALAGAGLATIEVHISNIHKRERFRHHSHTANESIGVIAGLGLKGYSYAVKHLLEM